MKPMTISKVAKQTGVGIETLRFYSRRGLIEEPPRTKSGYRLFPKETIDRVRFIKRAQEVGFSLAEISELLELRVLPDATALDVRERAIEKIDSIAQKIQHLEDMKQALIQLTQACDGKGPIEECPILRALDGNGQDNCKEMSCESH